MFHVRRRPADHAPRKRKKKVQKGVSGGVSETSSGTGDYHPHQNSLPLLVELGPGETVLSAHDLGIHDESVAVEISLIRHF